jgi:hypothetical protein
VSGGVKTPRFRLTMNGSILDGITQLQVSLPLSFRVGQFSFTKAFLPQDDFPASWWSATSSKTMLVSVSLSTDGENFLEVITGNVDTHRYDPIANCISVAGRDLAALLCDERIVATYRNQTASQIATSFAAEHGLNTSITATKTLAGRFYDIDHDETHGGEFSCATNEWDLLCRLGSQEGITPYVFGNTLFFNPPSQNPPTFPISFSLNAAGEMVSNVTGLTLERHMTEARDIVVTVRSWHSRKKASLSATVRTKTKSPGTDSNVPPSTYLILVPNLTQQECLAKAQQLALDYSQHERNLSVVFPSFGFMNPATVVPVSGTGTDYDMTYYPQAITYSVDFESGARTEIFAKFSSELYLYDDDTGEQIGESPDLL